MTVCLFTATSTFLDRDIGVLGSSAPLLSTFQAPLSLLSDAHWRCSLSTCTPRSYSSSSMQSVDMYSSILSLIVDAVCRHELLDPIPHRRCSLSTCTPRSYPSACYAVRMRCAQRCSTVSGSREMVVKNTLNRLASIAIAFSTTFLDRDNL